MLHLEAIGFCNSWQSRRPHMAEWRERYTVSVNGKERLLLYCFSFYPISAFPTPVNLLCSIHSSFSLPAFLQLTFKKYPMLLAVCAGLTTEILYKECYGAGRVVILISHDFFHLAWGTDWVMKHKYQTIAADTWQPFLDQQWSMHHMLRITDICIENNWMLNSVMGSLILRWIARQSV